MAGHFAIRHTVSAVSERPSAPPSAATIGPLSTSESATVAAIRISTSVISSWIGLSFQNGRPSSTS